MDKIPLPNAFKLEELGPNRANLIVEPLFSGYGMTIGNALRRVLLSSMPGAAITAVKIKGVDHEFSTLEGVKEDIVDIILNFKKLRLKLHAEEVRLTLKVKGKKDVTAGDIDANADVEIANPELHLATITNEGTEFEVEMTAKRGRGYSPTESRNDEPKEIGMIAIDAIYTPMKNVALHVENTRVGQVTNFERVTLEIETDGTMSPKEAVSLSSQIIVDHFALMLEKGLEVQTERTDLEPEESEEEVMADDEFTGTSEVEAPAPKKRGRPRKEESVE